LKENGNVDTRHLGKAFFLPSLIKYQKRTLPDDNLDNNLTFLIDNYILHFVMIHFILGNSNVVSVSLLFEAELAEN